ncbi:copper chaperone PCu(A)C [Beijerinckia sp. L45]|uniref:copper chaperone PCu(A)C n=1 Tax=Beijerinckia sp. L45 TaxID=1641855 RepID=UPI00131DB44D|nr:copper chaperone PCu(A)C [Beijerinckia sp. L45]
MRQVLLAAALIALGSIGVATVGSAADSGPWIVVKDPWLRATPNGAKVAGGYVTITNTGKTADMLVAASIAVAPTGEIHTMSMENGVMHMGRLDHGLAIPPGATVTLKPGGDHLMFLDPTAPIKEGVSVIGSLTFAKAGVMPVAFAVGGMAAKAAPAH